MSIVVASKDLFVGENAVSMFLQKTEDKDFSAEVPFALKYWAGRLSKKITSALREVREDLQKLNDEYGINKHNANKPLIEVLGSQIEEFNSKRDVIMENEITIDIFPKKVTEFESITGLGGVTLMGLMPFLEDDFEKEPKSKKESKSKKGEEK